MVNYLEDFLNTPVRSPLRGNSQTIKRTTSRSPRGSTPRPSLTDRALKMLHENDRRSSKMAASRGSMAVGHRSSSPRSRPSTAGASPHRTTSTRNTTISPSMPVSQRTASPQASGRPGKMLGTMLGTILATMLGTVPGRMLGKILRTVHGDATGCVPRTVVLGQAPAYQLWHISYGILVMAY